MNRDSQAGFKFRPGPLIPILPAVHISKPKPRRQAVKNKRQRGKNALTLMPKISQLYPHTDRPPSRSAWGAAGNGISFFCPDRSRRDHHRHPGATREPCTICPSKPGLVLGSATVRRSDIVIPCRVAYRGRVVSITGIRQLPLAEKLQIMEAI